MLSVRHLGVWFPARSIWPWRRRGRIHAIDDLHLDLKPGETLGIVGESGCGKSTLARALVGLQAVQSGSIRYAGQELVGRDRKAWRPLRREIQMVFQDPAGSLDPRMKIGEQLSEPLRELCPEIPPAGREARVREMLERVGLPADAADRRAQEFSGGQAQRIAIARALIVRPRLLICDEVVSALDVSVQAQIVNLLADLQREYGLTLLFIAHDLAVIRHLSARVLVMYGGRVMEQAGAEALFRRPMHPYTRALLAAAPSGDLAAAAAQQAQPAKSVGPDGPAKLDRPDPAQPTSGCVFHVRCPLMESLCVRDVPNLRRVGPDHYAACHYVG